jgi:hypothetical protein
MPTDSTGFRSLVEQIQRRDNQAPDREPARERPRRGPKPGATREIAGPDDRAASASTPTKSIGFLSRRWL